MEKYVFSASPHIKSPRTTKRIMIDVCIAMLPACIMGCVLFGWQAIVVLAVATLTAVLSEIVYRLCDGVKFDRILKEFDFTSVVTGMLVGMNMPAGIPVYIPVFASIFAIVVVKMLFGGTGKNLVNPAIAGRVFAFMSFAKAMTTYPSAIIGSLSGGSITDAAGTVVTGATPLSALLGGNTSTLTNLDLFLGTGVGGVIGETCKAAIILGGIYLVIRKVLNFHWPIVYVAVTGLVTVALNGFDFAVFLPSILSGGLILGAVFMATDFVTTPDTKLGNYIYFVVLGALTAVLRHFTSGEVVSFAILFMNLVVPIIDKYVYPRPFGYVKKQKEVK